MVDLCTKLYGGSPEPSYADLSLTIHTGTGGGLPSLPVRQCDLACDYTLLSLGFLIMDVIKNPVCGVVRINPTKCKTVARVSMPSRSLRNDGKKMEEEEADLGGCPDTLPSCKVQRKGPGSSSSGFPLLTHVAWPHTDSQEWQTELLLEIKAGWGSAGDEGLEAGRQRTALGLSPSPGLLSLNALICTQGSLWVPQAPIICFLASAGWESDPAIPLECRSQERATDPAYQGQYGGIPYSESQCLRERPWPLEGATRPAFHWAELL